MARLLRQLLNLLAALSLFVFAALMTLFIRSGVTSDDVIFKTGGGRLVCVESDHGELPVTMVPGWPFEQPVAWQSTPVGPLLPRELHSLVAWAAWDPVARARRTRVVERQALDVKLAAVALALPGLRLLPRA